MKELDQYGLRKDEEWEWLPWRPPETRPPFKIRTRLEDIAPFFFVEHHPYALSLLLKISDGFKTDVFRKMGLEGSSKDVTVHTHAMHSMPRWVLRCMAWAGM